MSFSLSLLDGWCQKVTMNSSCIIGWGLIVDVCWVWLQFGFLFHESWLRNDQTFRKCMDLCCRVGIVKLY